MPWICAGISPDGLTGMTDVTMIYSTFPTQEAALSVARALLEQKLIACANVYDNVTSLYRWEGKIQQEPEAVLIAKTRKDRVAEVIKAIKNVHSYEVPCIIAYPVEQGFPPFIQWVKGE